MGLCFVFANLSLPNPAGYCQNLDATFHFVDLTRASFSIVKSLVDRNPKVLVIN